MKDKNILSVGIIIGIAAILLIVGLYFIVLEHKGSENSSGETPTPHVSNDTEISYLSDDSKVESRVEIHTKDTGTLSRTIIEHISPPERMPNIKVSFTKITHNTKPAFKVGDRFEYHSAVSGVPSSTIQNISEENISKDSTFQTQAKTICNVINKERLKGEECFIVECIYELVGMGGAIIKEKDVYYISLEDGEIKKAIHNYTVFYKDVEENLESFSSEIPSPNSEIYDAMFYSPWMLSLNDDFKMKIEIFQHPMVAREEIAVIGEEKIKNKGCYLVEYRQIDKDNNVLLREKRWIDKEKRILVKSEGYYGNLRILATELVS